MSAGPDIHHARDYVVELHDVFCVHRTGQGDAAALAGADLELERGEVLCVLGRSGAGKSTLLRVIAGLQQPSAGAVSVLGHDIGRISPRARARLRHQRLGLLGQATDSALPPALPAGRAVELPLALRGTAPRARRARVHELLDAAGLRDRAAALPAELSGGERQRFALCAALAHRPALLLADEPTGELDDQSAQAIRALICGLARREGASAIVASHDPAMASISDRSVRLRDGRVAGEQRRAGHDALVIDRRGWLALAPEQLERAGLRDRARVRAAASGLTLEPLEPLPVEAPVGARPRARAHRPQRYVPARVELRDVDRRYGDGRGGRDVITGLTYSFAPGVVTAVTGRSGAGKTTLVRMLAGLDRPDRGAIAIDGSSLTGAGGEALARLRRERIGYVPQEPSPAGFLSAHEHVALALRLRGWEAAAAEQQARQTLARAGLAQRARQRLSRLSAGETQRLALARGLAAARGLLIADEPSSRLDELSTRDVAQLLADAAADGQTVICATHDPLLIAHAQAVLAL